MFLLKLSSKHVPRSLHPSHSTLSLPEFTSTLGRLMKTSDNEEEKRRIMRDKLMFLFSIYDKDSKSIIKTVSLLEGLKHIP